MGISMCSVNGSSGLVRMYKERGRNQGDFGEGAAETIKGPESGDKAGDKSEDKTAASAAYPEKEIQCIVTAAAGGGTDAMARAVCTPLEKTLGKAIVIINNGSASGLVGMGDIADADADGYTLGVFSNTDVANFVYGAGECDFTTEDFTYIAGLNTTGDILVLKKGTDMNGLEDFIQKAKEKPGRDDRCVTVCDTEPVAGPDE